MNGPIAIVVTIEGLGCNLVGCYGGAVAPTKNWDRLAGKSVVFDQFWGDTLQTIDVLESMWSGKHFAARSTTANQTEALSPLLERAMLVTDSIDVIESMSGDYFGNVLLVDSEPNEPQEVASQDETDAPPEESVSTQIERLLEAALGRWETSLDAFPILWIHSQGLNSKWDAPYDYRCVMCDEGDPDPPQDTEPVVMQVTEETDPDEVFGVACSVGAQAIAMDEAWSMIDNFLSELGLADRCLQVLAGTSGYPLGEHGWVGIGQESLYAESIHLPLIVSPGQRLPIGIRIPMMVQPDSLLKYLTNWMHPSEESQTSDLDSGSTDLGWGDDVASLPTERWPIANQMAYTCYADQVHVVVPAWSCRWSVSQDEPTTEINELFAMPDDRWQQNEISQRALSVLEQIVVQRDNWIRRMQEETHAKVPTDGTAIDGEAMPCELTHPIR